MMGYWINGCQQSQETRRSCLYGDGLFETLVFRNGRLQFWSYHWQRLQTGLHRLQFPFVTEDEVMAAIEPAIQAGEDAAIIRLSITRTGQRGYRIAPSAETVIEVLRTPLTGWGWHSTALKVYCCKTRWAQQPLLAGIKHLNRLEQILARSEWTDADIAEGIVCDTQGNIISGTMSGLLVRVGQTVFVPDISQTGIDSIARQWVISQLPALGFTPIVQSIRMADVLMADEVLLMNVVQGIACAKMVGDVVVAESTLTQILAPLWVQWQTSLKEVCDNDT
ncbi:MAG: aminodeoxychorismate lyase [Thiotrichales bacterium]|nr:aminodeoxychorismate lyase [Thiotrichales bacterium]